MVAFELYPENSIYRCCSSTLRVASPLPSLTNNLAAGARPLSALLEERRGSPGGCPVQSDERLNRSKSYYNLWGTLVGVWDVIAPKKHASLCLLTPVNKLSF